MSARPRSIATTQQRRVRLEVEALEDRLVPASITVNAGVMVIVGDNISDTVRIIDDGQGGVAAQITNANGTESEAAQNTSEIIVRTRGGADNILYLADRIDRNLTMRVIAGEGEDSIRHRMTDGIALGSTFSYSLRGGANRDTIRVGIRGDINGEVIAVASGGADNDRVIGNKFPGPGSNVFFPTPVPPQSNITLNGNNGNDILVVRYDPTSNHNFLIHANGGAGTDTGNGLEPDTKTSIENDNFS